MSVWGCNHRIRSTQYFAIARWIISKTLKSSVEASGLLSCWVSSLFLVTAVPKLPSTGALWHAAAGQEQSRRRRSRVHFFSPSVSFTSLNMHRLDFAFHLNLQNEAHWFILQTHLCRAVMSCPPKKGRDGSADKIEKGGWFEVSLICLKKKSMTSCLFFFPSSPLRVWQHTAAVTVCTAATAPPPPSCKSSSSASIQGLKCPLIGRG